MTGLLQGGAAGEPPLRHWARAKLEGEELDKAWRPWQVEIGYRKPDDPA